MVGGFIDVDLASSSPVSVVSDLTYGSGPNEILDVYRNTSGTPEPGVVMIHGGGWSGGDKLNTASKADELAQAGYVVFNIDFPLDSSSQAGFPMEVDAVTEATRWAIRHAAHFGADPSKMNLLGGSSGATLADQAGERLNATTPGTVTGVISLSARTNFVDFEQDLGGGVSPGFDPKVNIPLYLGCSFGDCPTKVEHEASPVDHVTSACAKYLLFNSDAEDMPLDQAQEMNSALRAHDCSSALNVLAGTKHAFAYWSEVLPQIEEFLASTG
jgi:acetyl esterase/lipase